MFLVGSLDYDVIQLNEVAYEYLNCEKRLKVINGASHLFEEEGKLDEVADEAIEWFQKYLIPVKQSNARIYV